MTAVRVPWNVSELTDVGITAPATGDMLRYDASAGVWKNVTARLQTPTGNVLIDADTSAGGTGDVVFTAKGVERLRISNAGLSTFGAAQGIRANETSLVYSGKSGFTPSGIVQYNLFSAEAFAKGVSPAGPTSRMHGFSSSIKDDAKVDNWAVTGAANNGSGLIRLTVTATGIVNGKTLSASIATGDPIGVYGVAGTTEANGQWVATVIDATHIDLQGSTFTHAYTSGGKLTNRGAYYNFNALVWPTVDRSGLIGTAANGDDIACYSAYNRGTGLAADCFYIGRNSANFPSSPEFLAGYSCAAYVSAYAFGGNGWIGTGGAFLDASTATYDSLAYAIRIPNNTKIVSVNGAGTGDVGMWWVNGADHITTGALVTFPSGLTSGAASSFSDTVAFSGDITLGTGKNMHFATDTGTMFGTTTTQKFAFYGATPIPQVSNTTDLRAALINYGLYASGGATPLNLNGGLLTAGAITNGGALTQADATNIILGTTTGTKIGTATSQKMALWNKTPIVQPTTSITGATRVGGVGTTVKIDDTYGGYTLAQAIAIIINTGLAA